MLLHQLKFSNIRSYVDETISFPLGTTLLAGDIGSGKSTILLAIEFALFGASKTDLPAEILLRKGATQGAVELTFSLEGKEYTLGRGLKKERESIKQTAGYLRINGVQKDLMPLELKAEVLNLLGYPEEFLTKNKNYIFRYTVYTPQEEMKQILQEDAEERLDTLRKIFNVDKYKTIRENVQLYLKTMRTTIATLKTRLEPLEGKKQKVLQLQEEQKALEEKLQQALLQEKEAQKKLQEKVRVLEQYEAAQREYQEALFRSKTILALLRTKEEQGASLQQKKGRIQEQRSSLLFPAGVTEQEVQQQIQNIESKKEELLQHHSRIKETLQLLQRGLQEKTREMSSLQEKLKDLPAKKAELRQLSMEIQQREELQHKIEQCDELAVKSGELIARNQTLLENSSVILQNITIMEVCPTCLQKVDNTHRQEILTQEQKNKVQAETLLFELKKKKLQILEQRTELKAKVEALIKKENTLTRLRVEVATLEEKKNSLRELTQQRSELEQQYTKVEQQLQLFQEQNMLTKVQQELQQQRELFSLFLQQNYLQQQSLQLITEEELVQKEISAYQQEQKQWEEKLKTLPESSADMVIVKKEYEELVRQEKNILMSITELKTKKDSLQGQQQELQQEVTMLVEEKNKVILLQERYHWLEGHFVPLTHAIEKHVMISIHRMFNQLFQEWFFILINDESVLCKLDDAFTPIVEQNGYEVFFSYLSGGEKTSAALAYRLALNRVINDVVHQIKTKDILILDEPTDGFSSEQLDKVREVLERLSLQQMIVVSHEVKIESFVQNVIRVEKQGHVSKAM